MDWDALTCDLRTGMFNEEGTDFSLVLGSPRGMEPNSLKCHHDVEKCCCCLNYPFSAPARSLKSPKRAETRPPASAP